MIEAVRVRAKLVVAFDLDDTLYPQESHIRGGFTAVARAAHEGWGFPVDAVFERLWSEHRNGESGKVINNALAGLGVSSRSAVRWLVGVYRHHAPKLTLPEVSDRVLESLADHALYIVTDGHKAVQDKKLQALALRPRVRHCYITHRYGVRHAKPSPHVFQLMVARERCAPEDVVYVGDNPHKDFRGIRPLGFRTIRVLTGPHSAVRVPSELDAEVSVASLREVPTIVATWEARTRGASL